MFYETASHPVSVEVRKHIAKKHAILCLNEIINVASEAFGSGDYLHFNETSQFELYQKTRLLLEAM